MAAPRLMTTQQYLMTDETLRPQELIFGVLRMADAPKPRHQQLVAELFVPMALHVRQGRLGTMWLSPLDVVLDDEQGLVVQPDMFFIGRDRLPFVPDRIRLAPDLMVEVLSPLTRLGSDPEERLAWFASVWRQRVLAGASVPVEDGGGALRERQDCGASVVRVRRPAALVGAARLQAGALRSARQQPRHARQLSARGGSRRAACWHLSDVAYPCAVPTGGYDCGRSACLIDALDRCRLDRCARRSTSPSIDVIVPVHGAGPVFRRCAASFIAHADAFDADGSHARASRLVIVLDGPPDAESLVAVEELRAAAQREEGGFELEVLTHETAAWVRVERESRAARIDRDAVLLNSDTQVTAGWLGRLREAAYSDPKIATVTPFSNNATICSLPRFLDENAIPAGHTIDSFGALVTRVSRREYPRLPTGVGFCLYVKRSVLDEIGAVRRGVRAGLRGGGRSLSAGRGPRLRPRAGRRDVHLSRRQPQLRPPPRTPHAARRAPGADAISGLPREGRGVHQEGPDRAGTCAGAR